MLDQLSPEEKKTAIEAAVSLAESITELPFQIENLARVNLAQKFLVYDEKKEKMNFMVNEFEKAWKVITGEYEPVEGANGNEKPKV